MSDYNRLKEYLTESKSNSSLGSTLNGGGGSGGGGGLNSFQPANVANTVLSFFNKNSKSSQSLSQSLTSSNSSANNEQSETDSWFREAESDPYCPKLSKKQRIIGFMLCICVGVFCMFVASLYIPLILVKSRKFVLLFSTGSLFFISSFALLWGVKSHLKHLFNSSRLPFTLAYFGTLIATIYYAIWVKSVLLTLIFAILQVGSLAWYLVSYLPGGQNAFKLFAKLFYAFASKSVQTVLPI